jgi:hypothetical protein
MVKSEFIQETVEGQTYWMSPDIPPLADHAPATYLLPGFDEYLLGYTDRSAVLEAVYSPQITPGNNGVFSPTIVIDGRVAGTWKRTFKKGTVVITLNPFTSLSEAQSQAIAVAARRYGSFVGMSATVVV